MTLQPCLDCGEPVDGRRCPACTSEHWAQQDRAKGTARQRGYRRSWDRLSERARRLQPFCVDCGATADLQAHHLRWPARTLRDVEVVCTTCHARRPQLRTRGVDPRGITLGPTPQAEFRYAKGLRKR